MDNIRANEEIEIEVVETEFFNELLEVANDMLSDEEIPLSIRDRYRHRIEEIDLLVK